jgi:ferredoxin
MSFNGEQITFDNGDQLPADIVIVAVGDSPASDWIPDNIKRVKDMWVEVNEFGQTSDPKVYAVGDVVKSGLLTEAIGMGRIAALALDAQVQGKSLELPQRQVISTESLKLIYFTPRLDQCPSDPLNETERCISCGTCRDCNICIHVCGQNAISRTTLQDGAFEFRADDELCIGCGFCAAACPSGIWTMVPMMTI